MFCEKSNLKLCKMKLCPLTFGLESNLWHSLFEVPSIPNVDLSKMLAVMFCVILADFNHWITDQSLISMIAYCLSVKYCVMCVWGKKRINYLIIQAETFNSKCLLNCYISGAQLLKNSNGISTEFLFFTNFMNTDDFDHLYHFNI